MKRIFLLFVILNLFQNLNVNGQTGNWLWARQGIGGGVQEGWSCATDLQGNVFATGFYLSTINFGSFSPTNAGGSDMFIVKYSPTGSVLWASSLGGNHADGGLSVATDTAGNSYVAGYFASDNIIIGTDTLINTAPGAYTNDIFLIKYSLTGTMLWVKRYGGNGMDQANSIAIDGLGNILITGYFNSSTIAFDAITLTSVGGRDIFIVKLTSSGSVLWANSAGGTGSDIANSITTDVLGNIYITGIYYNAPLTIGTYTLPNSGSNDVFIAKYSTAGNALWAINAGGVGWDDGMSIATDINCNVYITGYFDSPSLIFGTYTLTTGGGYAMFVTKYSSSGIVLLAKKVGDLAGIGGGNEGYSIAINTTGIYITGKFASPSIIFDSDTLISPTGGNDPMFIAKYDFNLNVICASALASGGDDNNAVATNANDDVYIAGDFVGTLIIGTDTLIQIGTGTENIFVTKYNCNGELLSINESSNQSTITLFPNPTTGQLTVNSEQLTIKNIKVFNVLGEEILATAPNTNQSTININQFSKGIYFAEIKTGGSAGSPTIVRKKIIKE